jgi:hypothetical protein
MVEDETEGKTFDCIFLVAQRTWDVVEHKTEGEPETVIPKWHSKHGMRWKTKQDTKAETVECLTFRRRAARKMTPHAMS